MYYYVFFKSENLVLYFKKQRSWYLGQKILAGCGS